MALIDLWNQEREQLRSKEVRQIIAFAGDGKLRDDSETSREFREFLGHVDSSFLSTYADQCLQEKAFGDSGLALQDVVNEVGRRLGFAVEIGRYRGKRGTLGHDGLWTLPDGHAIVVEVKTTDAYRIDLDTVAAYRKGLITEGKISTELSSILLVVGRADTGDLEAQIRGSRHAWDMRLISVDALLRLMRLREDLEDPVTVNRIHQILIPKEFTRLDEIVDLLFSAAEDVRKEEELEQQEDTETGEHDDVGKKFTPVSFHAACISRLEQQFRRTLVKRTRSGYSTPESEVAITCVVSKEHTRGEAVAYWFAFHPHQRTFLSEKAQAFVAFGCGSERQLLLIPFQVFEPWLEDSWITERDDAMYWHVRIQKVDGSLYLKLRKGADNPDVTTYLLPYQPGNG